MTKALMLALALFAAPVAAQMPAHEGGGRAAMLMQGVSPQGQKILRDARRASADPASWGQIRAARDKVQALLAADRLDVPALKKAMEEESRIVEAGHARRRAGMLEAFQKLSAADRKAFAANASAARDKMEQRLRARGGVDEDGPPML